ncbi:YciI family protein [Streptomyces sp. NPDC052301]|uniref:YciI family protein n=1 Tax=Streptomyces sp. NPDC052301 TaxID=3365687 RepID=UPI0037D2088F
MTRPLWVVHCLDAPGTEALRARLRPDHSLHLRSGLLDPLLYGPLVAEDGGRAVGSLLVVAAPDRDTVERHFRQDPFLVHGVWRQIRVDAFTPSDRAPVRLTAPAADGTC